VLGIRDFGADPDPRIHTSDLWIRIRIQEAQKQSDPMDPDSNPDSQH